VPQAPKPGVIPLRPLGVGELLDGGFTTIRRYPKPTLGLSAAVMLVIETIQIITTYYLLHGVTNTATINPNGTLTTSSGDFAARTATLEIVVAVATLVATALLSGMIAAVVGKGVLGRSISAEEAWAATRAAFWRLLGAILLTIAIEIGVAFVCLLPCIIVAIAGSSAGAIGLGVLGGIAAFVGFVYVQTVLLFTAPIVMLEKQGIRAAMSRSRVLVRGSWWRVFGIWLLAAIIAQVIAGIIGAPFAIAGGIGSVLSGNPGQQFTFTNLLVTGIGSFLAGTLVRPFSAGVTALLYLDRRMRAEALDLSLQQAAIRPS
jgi:hypothetical protein